MSKYYLVIFLMSVVFILSVRYYSVADTDRYLYRNHCSNDEDCEDVFKEGSTCVYDPDFDKNVCLDPGSEICKIKEAPASGRNDSNISTTGSSVWEKQGLTFCSQNSDCNKCKNMPQWGCYNDWDKDGTGSISPIYTRTSINTDGQEFCLEADGITEYSPSGDKGCPIYPPNDGKGQLIKNGGYCIPKVTDAEDADGNSACNPMTGNIILTQHDDYSSQWSCNCKNPSMFDHKDTAGSDCSMQKACGHVEDVDGKPSPDSKGDLYMPDGGENPKPCSTSVGLMDGIKCCSTGDFQGKVCLDSENKTTTEKDYTLHKKWSSDNTDDWAKHGKCACKPGFTYISSKGEGVETAYKVCEYDQCHKSTDSIGYTERTELKDTGEMSLLGCNCDTADDKTPYYSCPNGLATFEENKWVPLKLRSNPSNNTINDTVKNCNISPTCKENPCANGILAYYDSNGVEVKQGAKIDSTLQLGCKCNTGFAKIDVPNQNWLGETCLDPCKDNGPCGNGDAIRGTCVLNITDSKPVVSCDKCRCPYLNPCEHNTTKDECAAETEVFGVDSKKCEWDGEVCKLEEHGGLVSKGNGEWSTTHNLCQMKTSISQPGDICGTQEATDTCCSPLGTLKNPPTSYLQKCESTKSRSFLGFTTAHTNMCPK